MQRALLLVNGILVVLLNSGCLIKHVQSTTGTLVHSQPPQLLLEFKLKRKSHHLTVKIQHSHLIIGKNGSHIVKSNCLSVCAYLHLSLSLSLSISISLSLSLSLYLSLSLSLSLSLVVYLCITIVYTTLSNVWFTYYYLTTFWCVTNLHSVNIITTCTCTSDELKRSVLSSVNMKITTSIGMGHDVIDRINSAYDRTNLGFYWYQEYIKGEREYRTAHILTVNTVGKVTWHSRANLSVDLRGLTVYRCSCASHAKVLLRGQSPALCSCFALSPKLVNVTLSL